jgi:hypothetical protein
VYTGFLRLLGKAAFAKEQEAAKELRHAGITILGEKTNRGEHFVMWRQSGQTELLRIKQEKVKAEGQEKIDKLIHAFAVARTHEGEKEKT